MHIFLKNFTQDYASTSFDRVFSGNDKEKLLNLMICEHMFRNGFLEIGEELAKVIIFIISKSQEIKKSLLGIWAGNS